MFGKSSLGLLNLEIQSAYKGALELFPQNQYQTVDVGHYVRVYVPIQVIALSLMGVAEWKNHDLSNPHANITDFSVITSWLEPPTTSSHP